MPNNNRTHILLSLGVNDLLDAFEWLGTPEGESGTFTIGDRYLIRFLELRVTTMPESFMGSDKPILSIRYEAEPLPRHDWPVDKGSAVGSEWSIDGRDNLGTEYEVQQGASGFRGPERSIFGSDLSFEPDVPGNASWVEIRFTDGRHPDEPVHIFRADVPPNQSFEIS